MFRLTWQWAVLTLLGVACVTLFILEGNAGSAPTSPRPSAAPESRKPEKSTTAKPEAPIDNATVLPVDAIDGRILAALQKRVDVEFIQVPLDQVAAWASRESGVEVTFDPQVSIERNEDVTISLRDVTIQMALDLSLAEYKMGYFVANHALYLTTKDRARQATLVQIYPVADLARSRRSMGRTVRDFRPLCETILATVEPASWQALGDRVNISVCHSALSIRQSMDAHRQIADLLRHLREARDRQLRGETASPPLPFDLANASVIAASQRKVGLKFSEEPLSDVVMRLRKDFHISTYIDKTALLEASIDSEATEVTRELSARPLSAAIDRILEPFDMGYVIRDGVVIVSTQQAINAMLVTRAYPVADLLESESGAGGDSTAKAHLVDAISKAAFADVTATLPKVGAFKILDDWKILVVSQSDTNHGRIAVMLAALRSAKAVRNKSLPSTKKTDPTDDFELRVYSIEPLAKGDTPLAAAQAVESLIRETIARESWSDRRAYIKALPNRLMIRNQRAVHEEVRELLDQLARPGADEYIEVVDN